MTEIMNGYRLLKPLNNLSGYCRWTFAEKDGTEYFLKEFLDPVYPTKDSPHSEEIQAKIRESCVKYQHNKQRLYQAINETSDGNLVRIEEFFRWGNKYYITTRRINGLSLSLEEFAKEPWQEKLRVVCALSHSLMQMHERGIVHADIKADNVLLTRTLQGCITAKLIDVDCSFFEDTPPENEDDLGGDQVYFSPEGLMFKLLGPEEVKLSCKMDVYAMGLLIHQMLTGKLPEFPAEYNYAFEASLDDQPIIVSPELPQNVRSVLELMLKKDPEDRILMKHAFYRLRYVLAPGVVWDSVPTSRPVAEVKNTTVLKSVGRLKFGSFDFDQTAEKIKEFSNSSDHKAAKPASAPVAPSAPSTEESFFSAGGDL